ncbi:MAG TPA: MFS transporter [Candidatus Limnocylindrales bacterium]|nr:MFS transporter [Candidatus Limnocylindrales bacterium]
MTQTATAHALPARTADLFAPGLRGLSIGLVSTITLVALESLAIGTVMPIVAAELGDLQLYGWVYTAFFLGNLLGIVLAGGALDRMPLHRPFAAGLVLFGAGLVIGGLAPSMPILVLARFIQGLGGGAVGPTAYVAIGRVLPDRLQPRMFALMSTAWVVPGIIGPSIAAVVGELASWRWVFLGLVPLLVVAGGLAVSALRRVGAPTPEAEHEAAHATIRRLPDALLAAGGAGLLVAGLTAQDLRLLIAGVILGGAMLLPAYRRLTPRGTLLLALGVPAAVLLRGVMTFAFFSGDAYLPLLLQTWRGTPATLTGIVFTVTTVSWTAGTWYQARKIDRWGPRRFVSLGFAFIAIGAALTIAVVFRAVPPELAVVTWILPGIGMGFMYSAVTLVVLRGSSPTEQGSASSALQLSDILGTALGTGVAGAITAAGTRAGGDGLGVALAVVFGVSLVSALLGLLGSGRIGAVPHVQEARTAGVD